MNASHSPGRDPEVFLDEVADDGERQEGHEEDGGHVGDDAQGGHTQQRGAREALQSGGDVLIDCVCVCGEPVQDAAEGSRLKQPEDMKTAMDRVHLKVDSALTILIKFIFHKTFLFLDFHLLPQYPFTHWNQVSANFILPDIIIKIYSLYNLQLFFEISICCQ